MARSEVQCWRKKGVVKDSKGVVQENKGLDFWKKKATGIPQDF